MSEQSYRHHVVNTEPWKCLNVTVDVLTDRNASVAAVRLFDDVTGRNISVTATGSAKRAPDDPFDEESGDLLAIGRAFIAIGQALIDAAEWDMPE